MKSEIVDKILKDTEIGYDSMAEKFSQTRKFFWRGLEFIKDYAKDGDLVLDFGCGNGRLLELFADKSSTNFGSAEAKSTEGANPKLVLDKKIEYTGMDVSQKLLDLAKNLHPEESVSFLKITPSQHSLPFPDDYFNAVYSIAVFHHFPKAHAQKMAQELQRVTRSDGRVIITVWNLWQRKYLKNILKNWWGKLRGESLSPHQFSNELLNILFLNKLRLQVKKIIFGENWCGDKLDWNDCYISFKNNRGEAFQRFHHAFSTRELKALFEQAGFRVERCEVIHRRNIILIGRKL